MWLAALLHLTMPNYMPFFSSLVRCGLCTEATEHTTQLDDSGAGWEAGLGTPAAPHNRPMAPEGFFSGHSFLCGACLIGKLAAPT